MNSYKQKGVVTVDFLFAIVLVLGMGFLMFAFSFTLVVVELTQYVAFSTSRSYMAAQQTPADQVANAKIKYQSLVQNPILAPLYNNGWYNVPLDAPKIGKFARDGYNPPPGSQDGASPIYEVSQRNIFWGIQIPFHPKVLNFAIPFFGATAESDSEAAQIFTTNIQSFLGREPTSQECHSLLSGRWSKIKSMADYRDAPASEPVVINDNGC